MKIEFNMYDVLDSLKHSQLIPENFTLDELSITFEKWELKGKKQKSTTVHEVIDIDSDITLIGYSNFGECDCDE